MPFRFEVSAVKYEHLPPDREETVLTGRLVEGAIEGQESVLVPTKSGTPYRFSMTSLEAPGNPTGVAAWPLRPGGGVMTLGLGGHPPNHDIPVPCVVVADGADQQG